MNSIQKVLKDFSALPQAKIFRTNLYYLYFEPLYSPRATYLALQAYEFILHVQELKNHNEPFSKERWRGGEYMLGLNRLFDLCIV